jgi:hypothetical protein
MGKRIGHESQAPNDHKSPKKAICETDQNTGQEGALHEFVLEGFEYPVHA